MKRKELPILIAGSLIGVGLGVIIYVTFVYHGLPVWGNQSVAGRDQTFSPAIGSQAPDFELIDLSGQRIHLGELRGKPVLINFWATWCGPCRLEMPAIQARYEAHQPNLAILAVNFDEPDEDVLKFVDELGLTFEVLLDPGAKVQDLYRVRGYPTTFFVDSQGIIQVHHIGLMSNGQLDQYLEQVGVGK